LALGVVLCLVLVRTARAQAGPAAQLGQDTFVSGADVKLEEEVFGDALLVGGSIAVHAPVHGDAVAAAHELELRGPFRSNLYAAGGRVRVDGEVAGNARLLGGNVMLGPQTAIAGGVSIAAGSADISGSIGRYLQVAAGSTRVSGHVAGDVDVSGDELLVEPSAEIDGRVIFRGPEPASVAAGARVRGEVLHLPDAAAPGPWRRLLDAALFVSFAALGLAAMGLLSGALWPRYARAAVGVATNHGGGALLAGVAAVLGGPVVIALLALSMVGLPLALLVACAYLLSFPLGYVVAAASIAERLRERAGAPHPAPRQRALRLLAVLFGLGLLGSVPFIGPLSVAVLTLIGIGALVVESIDSTRRRHRTERAAPDAGALDRAPPADGDASLLM
jgi:hypothetical protein